MKYLKTFETINNSFYKEISDEEWDNFEESYENCVDINNNTLDILNKYSANNAINIYNTIDIPKYCTFKTKINMSIMVIELKDEWFMVSVDDKSNYLCDQLEGLDKLLSDLKKQKII